jgi:hypothetical protein
MKDSGVCLLPFLFQELCHCRIHKYLWWMRKQLQVMKLTNEEFEGVRKVGQDRVVALWHQ